MTGPNGEKILWICGCVPPEGQWEFVGVFGSEPIAVQQCKDATYFVAPVNLNEPAPTETIEFPGAYFPLASKPRWCVQSREGWCAVKGGKKPSESADSVETRCGHAVILPWGHKKRIPDCGHCLAKEKRK